MRGEVDLLCGQSWSLRWSQYRELRLSICFWVRNAFMLHIILLGVGSAIYNNPTLEHFNELGLDFQELRNLLPSFMHILSTTQPNLSTPDVHFPVLLSTLIRSRFQLKLTTLLIPIYLVLFLWVEEFYGTQYQSGSFSLINVGSVFSLPA